MAITSLRHRGLRDFFSGTDERRIHPTRRRRVRQILAMLDAAASPPDMNAPGLRLHPLKGALAGRWAVDVSANWRITFAFRDGDAVDVDLEDYH